MSSRNKQIAWLLLGALLLVFLIWESGPLKIAADLSLIGKGLAIVLALEFVVDWFHTLGWWFTFPPELREGTLSKLFFVRLAGTALNSTLPAGSVGGEPAKVYLLENVFPVPTTIATVMSSSLLFSLSKAGFIAVGMMLMLGSLHLSHDLVLALVAGFVVTIVAVIGFLSIQLWGFTRFSTSIMSRISLPERWSETLKWVLPKVDSEISTLYRTRPGDIALAICSHESAFVCGVLQVLLLLGWLGLPRSVGYSIAIESFAMLVGFVGFMLPGQLGVQEGGKVVIFTALGLPAAAGLTVGMAFRLISLAGAAAGLITLTVLKGKMPRAAVPLRSMDDA